METIGFNALKGRVADAEDSIADKVDKSGNSMTGDLDMGGNKVTGVGRLDTAEIRSQSGVEGDGIGVGGILDLNGYEITDVGDPVNAGDAANKGYVDTGLATKQNKAAPYKGANNQAGILIDLVVETINSQEIIFNILYNETASGYLTRQAVIHGQVYGGAGNRTGMVQNGNTPVEVFYFQGTPEGFGSTHSFLWIPSSAAANFPSTRCQAWVRASSGLYMVEMAGIARSPGFRQKNR